MRALEALSTLRGGRARGAGVVLPVNAWRAILVVVGLVLWEIAGRSYPALLSYPTRILGTFPRLILQQELIGHLGYSLATLLLGYSLASVAGIVLGIILGISRLLSRMMEPYVNGLYATPRVALVPLIVLWFGIGYRSVVFTLFLLAVFPILISTIAGVRSADAVYLEVARAFRIPRLHTLFKVVLPGAIPFIATGTRLGAGRAVTGLIIGEMFIRERGIGKLLDDAALSLIADRMYALVLLIALIGAVFSTVFKRIEQRLSSWRPSTFDI